MQNVLLLAANPELPRLRLDADHREIQQVFQLGAYRDRFAVHVRTDVRWRDLRQAILDIMPTILHFSGHGEHNHLVLTDDVGGVSHRVPFTALRELLGAGLGVRVLVLSACNTDDAAVSLAGVADHVIAMHGAISDAGAVVFAQGFYSALANGHSIATSFAVGRADVIARSPAPTDVDRLVLRSKPGAATDLVADQSTRAPSADDPMITTLLRVTMQSNPYPQLPRTLAKELGTAFPQINGVIDVIGQASTVIQQAGSRIPEPYCGHHLSIGRVPLETGAYHAWNSAVRDAAALSPYAVLAILLVVQEQRPGVPTVGEAITTILSLRD